MARKQAKNQLPLDFTARGDRIVFCGGNANHQLVSEKIFEGLLAGEWGLEPSGDWCELVSAEEIIRHIGHRLPYPEVVKIARMQRDEADFIGFAAVYKQRGWVFVSDWIDANERNYTQYFLTVILGLYLTYPNRESLEARALSIIAELLLPAKEVSTFFHAEVSKISPILAADIADYFKAPFGVVLRRAFDLGIVSEAQFESFNEVIPAQNAKQRELYVTGEGNMDDLESYLFGGNEN